MQMHEVVAKVARISIRSNNCKVPGLNSARTKQGFSSLRLVMVIFAATMVPLGTTAQNVGEESASCKEPAQETDQGNRIDSKPEHRWTQTSDDGLMTIALFPQAGELVFNDFHTWVVELSDHLGSPITDAYIEIDGGMKAHGHGLPSRPQLVAQQGGQYFIDGMLFNMAGDWTLAFNVTTSNKTEVFVVPITLSY